jgi:geranylgeranyl diphosphate synthase type I
MKRFRLRSVDARPSDAGAFLVRFERELEETVTAFLAVADGSPVADQVRWHFGIGCDDVRRGKRLRPRLLVDVALAEGGSIEEALDAAVAVECLHNYSLVHDDIEDRDELRHGRPTVWARFGLGHGINAGDSMCAVSYLTLLRNSAGMAPERLMTMARVLHAANFAMCVGQGEDIAFETAAHVTMDGYLAMIEGKTAALFGAACELGALCAGVDAVRASAYGSLGRAYGRAFQIRDDLLGVWASRSETGKSHAADLACRKWSFPIVWALGGPPSAARTIVADYYRSFVDRGTDVESVVRALDELGARDAAEAAMREHLLDAQHTADRFALDGAAAVQAHFTGTCAARGDARVLAAAR